jgi:hypothetical protein
MRAMDRAKKFLQWGKKKNVIALPYRVICTNDIDDKIKSLMGDTFISENCIHMHTSEPWKIKASGTALELVSSVGD